MSEKPSFSGLRFVYGEPVLLLRAKRSEWLVVGDIHIGAERRISDKGIRVYNLWEQMSRKLLSLAGTFSAKGLVLTGDIKDSILYPESWEQNDIRRFAKSLSGLEVVALRGNHDAHIGEIMGIELKDELTLGDYALLHGNKWPSKEAMSKKVLITGHNHVAVRITDANGGVYSEKAWLIASINTSNAKKFYASSKAKSLIVMPAFNPLILGTPVGAERHDKDNISPLFRNGVFDYANADVYSIDGIYMGKVNSLSSSYEALSRKTGKKKKLSP
ncbi:metallophosphoesterase [Candidatus Marsarchaeota archaeon]|nr:metallophosphoesterase [Candidatus Marsarchaeota archaeon]